MKPQRPAPPTLERTTALVARALGSGPERLLAGLSPATPSDLETLVAFRRECFGEVPWDDRRYLAWRYGIGSARRAYATLWTLKLEGALLGIIGTEEFTLAANGTELRAACPMDLVVHPRWLDAGVGAWLNLAVSRHHDAFVALGANRNSAGLVSRLYSPLAGRSTFKFPLNVSAYLGRHLAVPFVGAVIGAAANVGLRFRFERHRVGTRRGRASVDVHERFEPAWDESLRAPAPGCVAMLRTADYLNWRFVENPRTRYSIVAAAAPDGTLHAYAVYRGGTERRELHVPDYWASDDEALHAVMVRVIDLARRARAPFVAATAMSASAQRRLRDFGFVPRASEQRLTAVLVTGRHSPPLSSQVWELTDLGDDSDGSN